MNNPGKVIMVLIVFAWFFVSNDTLAQQSLIGKIVSSVEIIDPNNEPAKIPFIGDKVVMILYTDPDEKDVNDPLSNAVVAKGYPVNRYMGIGIANCKDTWIPDAAIRVKARQKQEQFPGSVILLDEERELKKAWGLDDCNNKGVVIIIGKDGLVKYIHHVGSQEESKKITPRVLEVIDKALQ